MEPQNQDPMEIEEKPHAEGPSTASPERHKPHSPHSPRRHSHRNNPDYLHEDTLKRVMEYLQSEATKDILDENAVALRMVRTARTAIDHVRYYQDLVDDSEDEEERAFQATHEQVENHSISQEFYKRVVAETQKRDKKNILDKRTLNWIRKAVGLHHHWHNQRLPSRGGEVAGELSAHSDEDSDPEAGPRRYTRGMARTTRNKKQKEREEKENEGLDALVFAAKELEKEIGPFPKTPTRRDARKRRSIVDGPQTSRKRPREDTRSKRIRDRKRKPISSEDESTSPKLIAVLPPVRKRGARLRRKRGTVRVIVIFHGEKAKRTTQRAVPQQSAPSGNRRPAPKKQKEETPLPESDGEGMSLLLRGIHPSSVFKKSHGDNPENLLPAPVSLSLLEWRRRQQWTPASESAAPREASDTRKPVVPSTLTNAGINAGLPPWIIANPIPEMQKKPSIQEPPRLRHSNATYSKWCMQLINCLNGSGRSWAQHEFFYSDLDRGWYNFDEFQVDIAKLGVPPGAKLTRKEWSMVRRNIPNRPRRFSKRFIKLELEKLNKYRNFVRNLQKSNKHPLPDCHHHEVPAPIKVGSTVTAYNSRLRILHRGLVLSHNIDRNGYLVQFERKELGFSYCPDTDVASHGIPEILIPAADTALDGTRIFSDPLSQTGLIPYGTSYGPVYDKDNDEVSRSLSRLMIRSNNKTLLRLSETPNMPNTSNASENEDSNKKAMINQVAERETLVYLMYTITATLERKKKILHAISSFNAQYKDKVKMKRDRVLDDHFAWLQANLHLTNHSLESAIVYLQVMYGDAFSGLFARVEHDRYIEPIIEDKPGWNEEAPDSADSSVGWMETQKNLWKEISEEYVSEAFPLKKDSTLPEATFERNRFIEKRLTAAGRALLTTNYCSSVLDTPNHSTDMPAMTSAMKSAVEALRPAPMPLCTQRNHDSLGEVDESRYQAMRELQEALSGFETELKALNTAQKILREDVPQPQQNGTGND